MEKVLFPIIAILCSVILPKKSEHVKMDETLLGSETDFFWKNTEDNLPALKTAEGNLGNGFHWIADYAKNTLLISGTGELDFSNEPTYLFPDMGDLHTG